MYELKNGKVFTSKFVGTGPSFYEKRIYRAAVSQRLRNTGIYPVLNETVTHQQAEARICVRHLTLTAAWYGV